MNFFKPWLQEYIVETLPEDEVIVATLNKKAFEVEEVISTSSGTVFEIKVLPNRAHDALGHHGMAYELCASLSLTFKKEPRAAIDDSYLNKHISEVKVEIVDEKACTRFASVQIDGVTVGESPEWLKKRLESIGQRSINNIVDITNYVQFALNKPMHAYDASSIKGGLIARFAREGESLTTLDDKELTLDTSTLVIADDEKVLGLAGIKGGKWSGIQSTTTSVILESANFEPVLIRKTSEKYGIRTDASKRFENGIANNLIIEGLHMTANLIREICKSAKRGEVTDIYPRKDVPYHVGISKKELNAILGSSYTDKDIADTLKKLSFPYEMIIPKEFIINTYPSLIGASYKWDSSMRYDAPAMFSCSSLVSYLFKGVWMPSISIDKYVFSKKITKEELRLGDMIFSNSEEGKIRYESVEFLRGTGVPEGIDHVALYLGEGKVIHATKRAGLVVEESLEEHLASRTIVGYGRVVEDMEESRYVVRVPSVRLDIRIKEDLAEEIGRVLGYDMLTPILPKLASLGLPHKRLYYESKIRSILLQNSFSEVMTYSFGNEGEVSLVKGLADDKEKLRSSLSFGVKGAFQMNLYNSPLLGERVVRMFEFGNIFTTSNEVRKLALAIDDGAKKSSFTDEVDMILSQIKRDLGIGEISYDTISTKPYIIEINFDEMIELLPEKDEQVELTASAENIKYASVSPYPFIVRDIAVWVPKVVTWEELLSLIKDNQDPLVRRVDLFDTFTKAFEDGKEKTSYAFRMVIQSYEKTLTDEEANSVADRVYGALKDKGYEIR